MALPAEKHPAPTQAKAMDTHYVVFQLGKNEYALPLSHVERAVRMVAITPLPEAPPWLEGVINLAGKTMPVIDLQVRLGEPKKPQSINDRLLVLADFILHVDEVRDVLEAPVQHIDPISDELKDGLPVEAVIREDDRLILLLDSHRLLQISDELPSELALPEIIASFEAPQADDDLTRIKGIGKVYAQLLLENGLRTYTALARSSAAEISALLGTPKGRPPDLQSWINQARNLSVHHK